MTTMRIRDFYMRHQHHSDMTKLYSHSEEAFATPPPNNDTATVIGPEGIRSVTVQRVGICMRMRVS
jgi:hypothetical protein